MNYEYIVLGSSSSSLSHPYTVQCCSACTATLNSRRIQANAHPVGSMSHDAVNTPSHPECRPELVGRCLEVSTSILGHLGYQEGEMIKVGDRLDDGVENVVGVARGRRQSTPSTYVPALDM